MRTRKSGEFCVMRTKRCQSWDLEVLIARDALHCSLLPGIRPEFSIQIYLVSTFLDVDNGVVVRQEKLAHRHYPVVLDHNQCLGGTTVLSLWGDLESVAGCQQGMV